MEYGIEHFNQLDLVSARGKNQHSFFTTFSARIFGLNLFHFGRQRK